MSPDNGFFGKELRKLKLVIVKKLHKKIYCEVSYQTGQKENRKSPVSTFDITIFTGGSMIEYEILDYKCVKEPEHKKIIGRS